MKHEYISRAKNYILAHIAIDQQTDCWNWTGSLSSDGYSMVNDRALLRAFNIKGGHRLSHHVFNGHRFTDRHDHTRHRCHNRKCVNPEHLDHGTAADNHRDRIERWAAIRQAANDNVISIMISIVARGTAQ